MAMRPGYAPPFHDLSEIGPGVRRATLNELAVVFPSSAFFPEQLLLVIATSSTSAVEKALNMLISCQINCCRYWSYGICGDHCGLFVSPIISVTLSKSSGE